MSLSALFPGKKSPWNGEDMPDLTGGIFLVTGGNSGIGKETIKWLLKKNGKVYMAARSRERANAAIVELEKETGRAAIFLQLDLADLRSVQRAALEFIEKEQQLNVLFNSGGVMANPIDELTKDGYDVQFGTNVLGHFLLTKLLLPTLIRTTESNPTRGKARVINLSSGLYSMYPRVNYETLRDSPARRKLSPNTLYAQSKFGNILFSNELARRYEDKLVAISLHPGVFSTGLQQHWSIPTWGPVRWMFNLLTLPISMSPLNQLYAGTAPEAAEMNGKYLIPWCREGRPGEECKDVNEAKKLWDWLEQQVASL